MLAAAGRVSDTIEWKRVSTTLPAAWMTTVLVRDLDGFARELALIADEADIWRVAPGVTNAVGSLTLHVCGNLQYFIGTVLGGTGYQRDRDQEFTARHVSREVLLAELRRTQEVIRAVLPRLTEQALASAYPEQVGGLTMQTGQFLTHLTAHLACHLGQAGYLRRLLTADARSAGPVPLAPLAIASDGGMS